HERVDDLRRLACEALREIERRVLDGVRADLAGANHRERVLAGIVARRRRGAPERLGEHARLRIGWVGIVRALGDGGAAGDHEEQRERPHTPHGSMLRAAAPGSRPKSGGDAGGYFVNRGLRYGHSRSAITRWPSTVGWMPSGWFRRASPATPSSRKGASGTPVARATAGYTPSGETPSPAVRLSPSAAMTWSAADAGDATSRRRTTGSARRSLTLRV